MQFVLRTKEIYIKHYPNLHLKEYYGIFWSGYCVKFIFFIPNCNGCVLLSLCIVNYMLHFFNSFADNWECAEIGKYRAHVSDDK